MPVTNLDQLVVSVPHLSKYLDLADIVFLGNPIVATTNRYVVSVALSNATLTIANQPDIPRNCTCTVTDQASPSLVAGTVTITGLDYRGNAVTEVFTQPVTPQATYTYTGVMMFAQINSIVTANFSVLGGVQSIVVGCGNVIALPNDIMTAAAIKHVWLGNTKVTTPTIAFGVQKSGVDASASVYNGTKALQASVHWSE